MIPITLELPLGLVPLLTKSSFLVLLSHLSGRTLFPSGESYSYLVDESSEIQQAMLLSSATEKF